MLIQGDSPWSMIVDLSAESAARYMDDRETKGINALSVSLLGSVANGGIDDDGRTYDGILPFVDGDVGKPSREYFDRAHEYLAMARDRGMNVFLYPVDAWVVGNAFKPNNIAQCEGYGAFLAERFADLPNLVWMFGGDYVPDTDLPAEGSTTDHCIAAIINGLRVAGDNRPFSIQIGFGEETFSTQNKYWRDKVDWNFVYNYGPTYRAVRAAYEDRPIPVILGEANYEGENNQPDTPNTTNETLRRQTLWALTSGAVGDMYGSADWNFSEGWENRLDRPGLDQVSGIRRIFDSIQWWLLEPDLTGRFLTSETEAGPEAQGGNDVLDGTLATATVAANGNAAIVYIPSTRTVTVDTTLLSTNFRAQWIDPTNGKASDAGVQQQYTSPGANADGDGDWILAFSADHP